MKKYGVLLFIVLAIVLIAAIFVWYAYKHPERIVAPAPAPILEEVSVTAGNGEVLTYQLLSPLDLAIASEGMDRIRFMAISPDERLFLTDMKKLDDNQEGKVYVLDGFDRSEKRFGSRVTYLSGLRNPNDLAFYTDTAGVTWLYIALTDALIRYRYVPGETAPSQAPETVATFPGYGLNYKYGGWHLTRSIEFIGDRLYVSVGSSCNACEERADEIRAEIIVMDPDGSNARSFAKGLRNAVGLAQKSDTLYATNMAADHFGDTVGDETLLTITDGAHYGWPFCYLDQGKPVPDRSKVWTAQFDCAAVPAPFAYFPAHSAPLDVEYLSGKSRVLRDHFLVALHGSGNAAIGAGYEVVGVRHGKTITVMTGFLKEGGVRQGRPAGILDAQEEFGGIFVSDDHKGRLYFLSTH